MRTDLLVGQKNVQDDNMALVRRRFAFFPSAEHTAAVWAGVGALPSVLRTECVRNCVKTGVKHPNRDYCRQEHVAFTIARATRDVKFGSTRSRAAPDSVQGAGGAH